MGKTLKNPIPEVFEVWAEAMSQEVGDNVSSDMGIEIAKTPHARLFMMGNPTRKTDLDNNEIQTEMYIQVELYASGNTALKKVYDLDYISTESLFSMGFVRTYGPEIMYNSDRTVKRLVSRYTLLYFGQEIESNSN